ncbi:MAG: metal-dependent hydrolase [Thermodesulfobacteriota bacterium]
MEILKNGIEITYFGHSTFGIKSVKGKKILIDPWVNENPMCPEKLKDIKNVDIIAVTHGHSDHIGDLLNIARKFKPVVISTFEIYKWLNNKGIENCLPINKGGSQNVDGIEFTMTHAQHSSSIEDEDGSLIYAGEPGGYVIKFENRFTIYHAGDTNLFGDMKLIKEIYRPELVMLPIGDVFTMSPLEASFACRLLLPKYVIPMHYATFPMLSGTPEELKDMTYDLGGLQILDLKPGESLK